MTRKNADVSWSDGLLGLRPYQLTLDVYAPGCRQKRNNRRNFSVYMLFKFFN